MSKEAADRAMELQFKMEADRGVFDQHFRETARLVWPYMNRFQQDVYEKGQKKTQYMYEATAPLAKDRSAAALLGFMAPEDDQWHTLTTADDSLNRNPVVARYLDDVARKLFKLRYDPKAAFSQRAFGAFQSLMVFGNGFGFTDARVSPGADGRPEMGFSYQSPALTNTYIQDNSQGIVDTVHHKPLLQARQIAQRYGIENLHANMRLQVEKNPMQQLWVLHRAGPNPNFRPGALGPRGMPFEALHVDPQNRHVMRRSGTRTLRYSIARAPSAPGELYGRGAAMTILPEIKTLNEMRRGMLRAQHNALTPAILLHSKRSAPLRLTPNAMNFGMLDEQGRPLAAPFNTGGSFQPAEAEMERIRHIINEAFMLTLLQILSDDPRETATKTLERAKERALIMGPWVGRVQTEFLGNQIEAELEIGAEMGILPEMPDELIEAQGEVEIKYQNDITRAQALGVIESYEQWKERRMMDVNIGKPEVMDVVDATGMARFDADASGLPRQFILDDDAVAEAREARAAQAAQAAELEQASQAADIAQKQAQTEQIAGAPA